MQFDTNTDLPPSSSSTTTTSAPAATTAGAHPPLSFPPVDPTPCARITVRVRHRNTIMTVQNVLVKTPTITSNSSTMMMTMSSSSPFTPTSTTAGATTTTTTAMRGGGQHPDDDASMSSSSSSAFSSSSSDDDDEMMMMDDNNTTNNNNPAAVNPYLHHQNDNLTTTNAAAAAASSASHGTTTSFMQQQQQQHLPECAYWMQRTIRDAIYGRVVLAVVLTRCPKNTTTTTTRSSSTMKTATTPATTSTTTTTAEWQTTNQYCAIKEMNWQHIRRERHKLAEDPIQEVAAMYYLQRYFHFSTTTTTTSSSRNSRQPQQQQQPHLFTAESSTTTTVNSDSWDNPFILDAATTTTSSSPITATIPLTTTPTTTTPSAAATTTPSTTTVDYSASLATNIMLPLDLLSDDRYLYSIMPYMNGGELFDRLDRREKFPESEARFWMKQILNGVEHLQRAGICHRDLSLENLLVHDDLHALVIDMGMCLRIPHVVVHDQVTATTTMTAAAPALIPTTSSSTNPLVSSMHQLHLNNSTDTAATNATTGVSPTGATFISAGSQLQPAISPTMMTTGTNHGSAIIPPDYRTIPRHWILPQGTCGKWIYMSPEIYKNEQPFDGHAVDLWAVGVILFLMLTGFPPWERACATDERFFYMTQGYLVQMLTEWNLGLSSDAMDLLQRMFWIDPHDRLSLEQVKAHPWMMSHVDQHPPTSMS